MDCLKLFESLSIIIASIAAVIGLFTWRKETRWKRKYELAEEVLAKFYEAHQNIKNIRSRFGYVGEGKSRKKSCNETEVESEIYDINYVVHERFEKNKEAIERLKVLKFRFIAVFGKEHEQLFNDLFKILTNIFFAASELSSIQLSEYYELTPNEIKKLRKIIYSSTKVENDDIEKELQSIIQDVENVCRKIIGNKCSSILVICKRIIQTTTKKKAL